MNKQLLIPTLIALFVGASVLTVYTTNTHHQLRFSNQGNLHQQFQEWKQKYNKKYSNPEEENLRFSIFSTNLKEINAHNSDVEGTYKLGLNEFSDLTTDEFNQSVLMPNDTKATFQSYPYPPSSIPKVVDYTDKLQPAQNQGNCASGWAFAATENNNFQFGSFNFSVQNLIDCAGAEYEADGCKHGTSSSGFIYINQQGQSLDGIYPKYSAAKHECSGKRRGYPVGPQFRGIALSNQYFQKLQTTILAASVDASSWKNYASGIFTGCPNNTPTTNFNHVINVVGYNLDEAYLIIRNSWGTSWGENGYLKLSFKSNYNPCGVFTQADYFINNID